MTVHLGDSGVSYFSVPKCGCTSLKSLFFEHVHGLTFEEAKADAHPAVGDVEWVHGVYPSLQFAKTAAAAPAGGWRFAVIRDPFGRIVSCYRNRVRAGKARRQMQARADRLRAKGLSPEPSLEEFIERLPRYRRMIGDIRGHSMPLSHFLGTDPAYFDRIYTLRDMDVLHDDLRARLGPLPPLPHLQTRGPGMSVHDLSRAARDRIARVYAEDIELFGHLF